eukprot:6181784-Pleurochrysis_carterae.AAC.1
MHRWPFSCTGVLFVRSSSAAAGSCAPVAKVATTNLARYAGITMQTSVGREGEGEEEDRGGKEASGREGRRRERREARDGPTDEGTKREKARER